MKKDLSFEQAVLKLEEIVKRMDSGDLPLEEAIKAYGDGVLLASRCQELLEKAEQTVLKLKKNEEGNVVEEPFEDDSEQI